jgi:tryptophan-rich sensory protein
MTDLTTSAQAATPWTTKNKVGLGLAVLYAVVNIPTVFIPVDNADGDGPPFAISLICTILAVVATVAGVIAWRQGSRPAARLTAASLIVITLTALPAFFLDVPAGIKVVAAVGVVLMVVIVALMFSGPQRSEGR